MLRIDDPAVTARRAAVLAAMPDLIVPFALDHPHVTVFVHGFVDPDRLAAPPWEAEPVSLRIGGANAFRSCVFLEARCGRIPELRDRFSEIEERWSTYRPHLTVGLFRAGGPVAPVVSRLRPFRRLPTLEVLGRVTTMLLDAFDPSGAVRRLTEVQNRDVLPASFPASPSVTDR